MYSIQSNQSGTRSIEITEENLQTVQKYALFNQLTDSTGYVDESTLDKLKLTVRSLIASQEGDCKDLLEFCLVLYHDNMKAFGLSKLIELYVQWEQTR